MSLQTRPDLTFKHNTKLGRHGWLRLTPAYSVRLVENILSKSDKPTNILDPFGGTGTTALLAAEHGIHSTLNELNPFLVWFCTAKTRNYSEDTLNQTRNYLYEILHKLKGDDVFEWVPNISNIEKWWSAEHRKLLSQIIGLINQVAPDRSPESDLLKIGFCRVVINWSSASFGHQSMSFKKGLQHDLYHSREASISEFEAAVLSVITSVSTDVLNKVEVNEGDARNLEYLGREVFDCVITSPPYPNRMSYIRELRPYMYWLGFLNEAREAGELDWKAIGGTWGIATSRVGKWIAKDEKKASFIKLIEEISTKSDVLARYVHKYFEDIDTHLEQLYSVVKNGGRINYVVGNSKFYDTIVPVQVLYADLMSKNGFQDVQIETLRKRNSKTELYEYLVSAIK